MVTRFGGTSGVRGLAGLRGVVMLAAVALAGAGLPGAGAASGVAGASTGITFAAPMVVDPVRAVGEPTIVHSPAADNTVYASGPWGTGTQRSVWEASADGGETFRLVNQCAPQSGEVATECLPPKTSDELDKEAKAGGARISKYYASLLDARNHPNEYVPAGTDLPKTASQRVAPQPIVVVPNNGQFVAGPSAAPQGGSVGAAPGK